MGNTAEKLKPLLLPAVVAVLWLISGWAFEALLTAGNGRIPIYLASLVSPDTMPVRIKSLLDGSGLVLVAGLTALAVAAITLVLLPDSRKTGTRGALFLANWMSVTLAAVAGSAVLAVASVLAQWPLGRAQWIFDLLGPSLLTGAYWGVAWGWVPALVATFLSAPASDGAGSHLPEKRHAARVPEEPAPTARVRQRGWALGAFALFSAAVMVALPLTARDPSQPAPEPAATPTPEPTVYGAAPVGAALSEPDPLWCTGEEVESSIGGWDAATGHRAAQITVRNTGTRSCTVQGYPDLDFESSDGWVMGITAVHGGSHMTEDPPVQPVTLAPGEAATASIGWRGTAGAGMVRVGTLLVAPYSGTQRQELEADIDLAEPGYLTVTAWTPAG
ncbi:DUF4232 domain-containing protein [Arthrobacter sp. zg-Y238]|uniref:DUF4232 domain-containing protein n=1 Tax=Arthrobacter sp. zg-Y238 TaxID=2964614 RepID=UPI002108100C|nr:DUF4232 domain-containing protein [Arthrobacter sp. zg-Y238]MCQ1952049.1 DUF4232 domain-containing protein [Arthrobacter sp. zg-Y238]